MLAVRNSILTIIFLLSILSNINAQSKLIFKNLTVKNGLSQSSVLSITQDKSGFLWFGTRYCLNKYDGQNFKVYSETNNNKGLYSGEFIRSLYNDKYNNIWVGTANGLDRYNAVADRFENLMKNISVFSICEDKLGKFYIGTAKGLFVFNDAHINGYKKIPISLPIGEQTDSMITALYVDAANSLWVGTRNAGLFKMVYQNNQYVVKNHFLNQNGLNNSISDNYVTCIKEDNQKRLWVGTRYGGINILQLNPLNIIHLKYNGARSTIINNNIRKILFSSKGKVWVATQNGLNVIDPISFESETYQHNPNDEQSISQNSIYDIVEDKQGSIWLATYFGGISLVMNNNTPFKVYKNINNNKSVSSNIISSIIADEKSNLWIGTEAGGLNYYNRKTGEFTYFQNVVSNPQSLGSNLVKCVYRDKSNKIWVGTSLGGLNLLVDAASKKFKSYKHIEGDSTTIYSDEVNAVLEDSKGIFWVATNAGLNIFHKEKQSFSTFHNFFSKKFSTVGTDITALYEDRNKNIWIGTTEGINVLSANGKDFRVYRYKQTKGLGADRVNFFTEDSKGNLWVSTFHGGLSLFDEKQNTFKNYSFNEGLPTNNIVGLLEDEKENFWLSTDKGLCKYTITNKQARLYNTSDYLPGEEFNNASFFKDASGQMYFGSYTGLISFYPNQIIENTTPPKVAITDLKLFNVSVELGDKYNVLKKNINYTDTLVFSYSQNIFSLNFSALNFIKPEKNRYAYKLEFLEKDWNYVTNPTATYTNLRAGNYTFLVKAANNDGIWNTEPIRLHIKILPPLWKTWWAYILYTITIATILFFIIRFFKQRAKLERDLYLEHVQNEREKELYQMKLDFFTNISHEIRTPLTLIKGPIDKLTQLHKTDDSSSKLLNYVAANTDRLIKLISELLDFRKAETNKLQLHVTKFDIVDFAKSIFIVFEDLAKSRNIHYQFSSLADSKLFVYADHVQLEKVFFNLLSNAFKFVDDGGTIQLEVVDFNHQTIQIKVSDNGRGIPQDQQEKVFENFYQVNTVDAQQGSGIGLAFSKSIIELHSGEIKVISNPSINNNSGFTCFTVTILKGNEHFQHNPNVFHSDLLNNNEEPLITTYLSADLPEEITTTTTATNNKTKNTILLVEDNAGIRSFIKDSLAHTYTVVEAENGADGLQIAFNEIPDIIISDVMMPELNGFDFCQQIKADERTNHIPVILLTAKTDFAHQFQGLELGADDYLTKPFEIQLLELKLKNLIESREKLKVRYSKQFNSSIGTENKSLETKEAAFLEKLTQILTQNIENSDFGVDELAKAVFMSRSVLYKKMAAITNTSVADFIKQFRLNKAAQLLKTTDMLVNDIAAEVGFNSRKYFSLEFKKQFGFTPSEYAEQKNTEL